jgi:ammonium transporter, Amt family
VTVSDATERRSYFAIPLLIVLAIAVLGALIRPGPAPAPGGPIDSGDTAWMLTASALVLLMTPGLSFFYGGMVRTRNVVSTMLQSFIAMGAISVLWIVVGFSLAFGRSIGGIIGDPRTFFLFHHVGTQTDPALAATVPLVVFAMFQLKFAIITPALITGSFAERVRFSSYLLFICLWSLVIYTPLAHWTWHPDGFLRQWGVLDFAGGTVVHVSAGVAALVGAIVLGRRKIHLASEPHTPANVPFVLLGTGMLWFGWFGFNAGSAGAANGQAALAFATTNTASATAALTWVFIDGWKGRRPTALGFCVGAVVGLVAITPAAGYVSVGDSLLIGAIGAIVSNLMVHWRAQTTLDDTLDVFPCHGVGGMTGMILTGVFASGVGLVTGQTTTFLHHVAALLLVTAYVAIGSFALYKLTNAIIPMRVTPADEEVGLDISQHGEVMDEAAAQAAFGLPRSWERPAEPVSH